jgi:hypothetical protein
LTKISSQKNPQENPLGWGAASLSVMTKWLINFWGFHFEKLNITEYFKRFFIFVHNFFLKINK